MVGVVAAAAAVVAVVAADELPAKRRKREMYDLIRFCDYLAVACFFGPPCIVVANISFFKICRRLL